MEGVLQKVLHVVIFGVESMKNIKDEGAVMDDLIKITKSDDHAFHLVALVIGGQITLDECVELNI
jgi:hypothetical protein